MRTRRIAIGCRRNGSAGTVAIDPARTPDPAFLPFDPPLPLHLDRLPPLTGVTPPDLPHPSPAAPGVPATHGTAETHGVPAAPGVPATHGSPATHGAPATHGDLSRAEPPPHGHLSRAELPPHANRARVDPPFPADLFFTTLPSRVPGATRPGGRTIPTPTPPPPGEQDLTLADLTTGRRDLSWNDNPGWPATVDWTTIARVARGHSPKHARRISPGAFTWTGAGIVTAVLLTILITTISELVG